MARPRNIRRIDAGGLGESKQQSFIAEHMLKHAGQKVRLSGGVAKRVRPNSGQGQKGAEPLGILGEKGKRLNSHHFRHFARISSGLLHAVPFAFP